MEKIAIITGGSKGIGKAICLKFLENKYKVITCSRNQNNLDDLIEYTNDLEGTLLVCKADLSSTEGVQTFLQYIKSQTAKVDVLVNNTGVFIPGKILEEEDGVLKQTLETNLYSAYEVTRKITPLIFKNNFGDIFNICSTASIMPYENGGSYCISKYALYGMTKVLREELKGNNIRVVAVLPGATFTSSWEGVDLPEDRFMKPKDVADSVWSAHQLSKNSVVEEILIRPQLGDL